MATIISPIHPFKYPRVGFLKFLRSRLAAQFEKLPTEIILDILLRLNDLATLDSLLNASPVVYRIFDEFAFQVTDTILVNEYRGSETADGVNDILVYLYIAAMIRSATLPLHSLGDFATRIISLGQLGLNMPLSGWFVGGMFVGGKFSPQALPRDTPPVVIRSLVATSRQLTALSMDCLKIYLGRFKALRPLHSESEHLIRRRGNQSSLDMNPWDDDPDNQALLWDIGPPTWLEEQRVIRSFWCLQLIVDIRKAATAGRLKWPPEDIKHLKDWDPTNIWSMEKLLRKVLPRGGTFMFLATSSKYKQIMAVMHYLESVHSRRWPALEDAKQPRLEVRRDWPVPVRQRHETLACMSEAIKFYDLTQEASYTSLGSFAPYNALGFALWCDERMGAYGLLRSRADWPCDRETQRHRLAYAWQSVLSRADREKLLAFRREHEKIAEQVSHEIIDALVPSPGIRAFMNMGPPGRTREEEQRRLARWKLSKIWAPSLAIDVG